MKNHSDDQPRCAFGITEFQECDQPLHHTGPHGPHSPNACASCGANTFAPHAKGCAGAGPTPCAECGMKDVPEWDRVHGVGLCTPETSSSPPVPTATMTVLSWAERWCCSGFFPPAERDRISALVPLAYEEMRALTK